VHVFRLGKTDGAAHKPLHPGPQSEVFALDFLRIVLTNLMLFGVDVPLVGPPQTASKSSLHQCGNKLTVFPHLIPPDSNRMGIEK
jgi:hypothetical protein